MNTWQTFFIVIGMFAAIILFIAYILPVIERALERRGTKMEDVLRQSQSALRMFTSTLETVKPFLTEVKGADVLDRILGTAHTAVGNAEQLYTIGQLEAGERKDAARKYMIDSLALAGVVLTPEIERLIDGAIEAEVLELGHNGGRGLSYGD